MVIQSIMSPKGIVDVWEETTEVFNKYQIPLTEKPLEAIFEDEQLVTLLEELNYAVGSSTLTCVKGG
ncbi:hypothetical protein AB5I83_06655 [Mesobacillus sp. LC4]